MVSRQKLIREECYTSWVESPEELQQLRDETSNDFMIDNFIAYKGEIYNVGLSDTNINKKQLVERIQKYIPDTSITYSDYYEDPDKRDYTVSNEKIESTGWKPKYSLDYGIKELIKAYQMIVPQESSHYRNAFPMSYGV